jgi:hypothetical protein
MANTKPTVFLDDDEVRSTEVPNASWDNGCNWAASNACGIGINMEIPNLSGQPQQFTLLDQNGDARDPQISGSIGHNQADSIRFGANGPGDGTFVAEANADLLDLAIGWAAAAP